MRELTLYHLLVVVTLGDVVSVTNVVVNVDSFGVVETGEQRDFMDDVHRGYQQNDVC